MSFSLTFQHVIGANLTEFWALIALAALDFVIGSLKALLTKKFQSVLWRSSFSKLLSEAGLPLMLCILATVNASFNPVIPIALGIAIAAEALSILELIKGKSTSSLLNLETLIQHMLTAQTQAASPSTNTAASSPNTTTKGA